jgi:hypothetical protein
MGSQTARGECNVSGIGVYYPDGTETQRKGVKINEIVERTKERIRPGKDELMEHAVAEFLSKEIERQIWYMRELGIPTFFYRISRSRAV